MAVNLTKSNQSAETYGRHAIANRSALRLADTEFLDMNVYRYWDSLNSAYELSEPEKYLGTARHARH